VKVASATYHLLDQIKKIPGTDKNEKIDSVALTAWITEVRRLCREYARDDVGDHCLGQLLAKAPEEEIASPGIEEGFHIGVRNSRGVHWRGEGDEQ
jgi:hypothetical protein